MNTNTKHTPGPWESFNEEIAGPNNERIATCRIPGAGMPINTAISNASMIANAVNSHSELLEACKIAALIVIDDLELCTIEGCGGLPGRYCEVCEAMEKDLKQIQAAITKAEGKV